MEALVALGAAFMVFALALGIFMLVTLWVLFNKSGQPGWAIIVPIYSLIVYLKIIGKPWWHMFLLLIPIYGWFILPIIWTHKLSKVFGHDVGFTLGLIFLGIIFYPILAFGSAEYKPLTAEVPNA